MSHRIKQPAPRPAPPADWVPVCPFPSPTAPNSFVSGEQAADRTRVAYFRKPASDHLFACVWFGPASEGPPENVHGGAIAAVLDEAMGAVCWMNGHPVVGARITINYTHLTPLGFTGRVESWIESIERRKIFVKSRLTDEEGKVHAEGDALFIKLSPELADSLGEARKRRDRTRSQP
jgi:acyl-coenzyme A thioesterase PaaI-like protein